MNDPINPPHYRQGPIECIDAIESALGPDGTVEFLRAQIMRYCWRFHHKDDPLTNARKLRWYADRLVRVMEGRSRQFEFDFPPPTLFEPLCGPHRSGE